MSNSESFIDEVTEEVRRDRLFALMRRYGWIAVLAIVLIVGGAAWNEWRKARETAAAQALGDAIMDALGQSEATARAAALEAVTAEGDAAALVALLAAGEATAAGEDAAALAQLRALADDAALPEYLRQMAVLKLVMVEAGTVPVPERRARLEPLAAPGQPFRPLALEQMAFLAAEEGDTEAAIDLLRQTIDSADATPGLRQRAAQLIVALGGSVEGS